jgi:betaine-aldehyde dehydrogenase
MRPGKPLTEIGLAGSRTTAESEGLLRAAEIVRERAWELARLESLFTGKTIRTSRLGDIPRTAEMLEFYAGAAINFWATASN